MSLKLSVKNDNMKNCLCRNFSHLPHGVRVAIAYSFANYGAKRGYQGASEKMIKKKKPEVKNLGTLVTVPFKLFFSVRWNL